MMQKFFLALAMLFLSATVYAENSLTLQIIPPKPKLKWKTPRKLLLSTLKATALARGHSIGHVTVHVKCEAPGPWAEPIDFMAGMTMADSSEERDLLLKKKVGAGIMFHWFKGHHEDTEEIKKDIPRYVKQRNRFATVRFQINHETCLRLHQYWQEYSERDIGRYYGLDNKPRHGEGAGCTAYATSYVDVAGLLTPELKSAWSRYYRVPSALIGTEDRKVSILKYLTSKKARRWATADEPHREIFFYDTQPMWSWMKKIWDNRDNLPENYSVDVEMQKKYSRGKRKKKIMALMIDRREASTPNGPIWIDY